MYFSSSSSSAPFHRRRPSTITSTLHCSNRVEWAIATIKSKNQEIQRMGSLRNVSLLKRRTFSIWKSINPTSKLIKNPFLSSYFSPSNYQHQLKPDFLAAEPFLSGHYRIFCSRSNSFIDDESQGPAAIDYRYSTYIF